MEPSVALALFGAAVTVAVAGITAMIKLQFSTLDKVTTHHEEFVTFRASALERIGAMESRVHEQDRVAVSRALEQVTGRVVPQGRES